MNIRFKAKFLLLIILVFTSFASSCQGGNGGGEGDDQRDYPCPMCDRGEITEEITIAPTAYDNGEKIERCSECDYEKLVTIEATKAIKLLVIGDITISDSVDSLYEMLHGSGLTKSVVAVASCAYNTGASIDMHLDNAKSNAPSYTLTVTKNGNSKYYFSKTIAEAIATDEWDYIAIGQSLVLSGKAESYGGLDELLSIIKNMASSHTKLLLHMPWSLPDGSGNAVLEDYAGSSSRMSESIRSAVKDVESRSNLLHEVIPVGTLIENLRNADFFDEFSPDTLGLTNEGKTAASCLWYSYLTGKSARDTLDSSYSDKISADIADECLSGAMENKYTITTPEIKSIKILIFGNSYGNDAKRFLTEMFLDAGYRRVVIGILAQGGCNINHHVTYLDDDPSNDFKGGFQYSKTLNGIKQTVENSYDYAIRDEDWDVITLQHAPAEVELIETYSDLEFLLQYIEDRVTNPDVKLVYHMIWKYYSDTLDNYERIVEITRERVLKTGKFSGVISSLELICQLRKNGITYEQLHRDYAHLSMGLGRFALGLMWYCYLTGDSPESITYRPTLNDVEEDLNHGEHKYVPVEDGDFSIIAEAIRNAIAKPYGDLTADGEGGAFDPDNFIVGGE